MSKVSVIISCCNGERTLDRCFKSVINQTYKNLEILFINHGSIDKSLEIAQSYSARDSRIRVIDSGMNWASSEARNLGIHESTGDYIQFIDVNDEMLPDMIETLLEALETNHAELAVCNFTGNPMFFTRFDDRLYDLTNESDLLEYYQNTFCMLLPWNKLYKRNVVTANVDEEVHNGEDELFNLAILKDVKRVICVNKPMYVYHYSLAEVVNMDETEDRLCLDKIIDATHSYRGNSIWYMGNELVHKRKNILENLIRNKKVSNVEDYLYTRLFDCYFWKLSAFAYMKVDKQLIINETIKIFNEKDFIKSLFVQEKYGIHYITYKGEMLATLVEVFIDLCLDSYQEITTNNLDVNYYEIFIMFFLKLFCLECTRRSTKYNKLYEIDMQRKENTTKESRYFYSFIEGREFTGEKVVV
jgi:glycosyltransferase involved in cell wall biosynthesis